MYVEREKEACEQRIIGKRKVWLVLLLLIMCSIVVSTIVGNQEEGAVEET